MRITGGTAKGHNLATPKSSVRTIRPTSDRTREALFNILAADIPGSVVLDLYAGTGSLGIEALSRGADSAYFVDHSRQALALIHANLCHCFTSPRASLQQLHLARTKDKQLLRILPSDPHFDIIFLDPPYERKLALFTLEMIERTDILNVNGTIVIEERKNEQLPTCCGQLRLADRRQYGETGLWLYQKMQNQL